MAKPKMCLLDEPTAGVNPSLINVIVDALAVMREGRGHHPAHRRAQHAGRGDALRRGLGARGRLGDRPGDARRRSARTKRHHLLSGPQPGGERLSALLATSGLHCGYGADEIIHAVDMEVAPGEIVTILGPNGCGKTTLVKCILGYVRTTKGRILFEAAEIQALRADRPGEPRDRLRSSASEHLQAADDRREPGHRRLSSEAPPRATTAKERMFELFPLLAERRHQKAATLSGGERQLLAMARA